MTLAQLDTAMMAPALTIAAVIIAVLLFSLAFLRSLLYICPPNEVLIFSGRRKRLSDGSSRGFRAVFGGRGVKFPIIEQVTRMSLNIMEVPIAIRGAYSKGGVALNVDAIANVKISSDPVVIGNAIERFLGRDPNEIRRVAKETLEGHLRGVLAKLTPEEINEDRLKFAEELSQESEQDLKKLGIHLDTFKIQHISDDKHYLDSIGREAIANVIRDAEIAESDAKRSAEQAEAESRGRANVIRANVEANISTMVNELRKVQAELDAQVRAEEERTLA
ncbi:MAG: flotillin family protein, partial [Armatimonadota bacterium]